jgi:hypothetical protein
MVIQNVSCNAYNGCLNITSIQHKSVRQWVKCFFEHIFHTISRKQSKNGLTRVFFMPRQ